MASTIIIIILLLTTLYFSLDWYSAEKQKRLLKKDLAHAKRLWADLKNENDEKRRVINKLDQQLFTYRTLSSKRLIKLKKLKTEMATLMDQFIESESLDNT